MGWSSSGRNLAAIPETLHRLKRYPNLAGEGAFPESLFSNPALFELVFESAVTPERLDLGRRLPRYIRRCYGADGRSAWWLLEQRVYTGRKGLIRFPS